jgi:hypothetical protein
VTIAGDVPGSDRVEKVEVILEVGSEGGSLAIVGTRAEDGWRFRAVRDESTLRELLNAEDRAGLEFWQQSDWVESLEGALSCSIGIRGTCSLRCPGSVYRVLEAA